MLWDPHPALDSQHILGLYYTLRLFPHVRTCTTHSGLPPHNSLYHTCCGNHHILGLYKKIKHKIVIIFLSISLNMCFGCSEEPSHRDIFFENLQHMFWSRNRVSVRRPSTFSNIFFSETTGPIELKFHMETP